MSRTLFSLAGFQVIIIGRFWVITEAMDLADAALVRVAEREGIRKVFTVDRSDFSVYRLHGRVALAIIP